MGLSHSGREQSLIDVQPRDLARVVRLNELRNPRAVGYCTRKQDTMFQNDGQSMCSVT